MFASLTAVTNPSDEVVIFEPFYEKLWPRYGIVRRGSALRGAPGRRTGAWIRTSCAALFRRAQRPSFTNSPSNPTGKVFSRAELELIAGLCQEFDALAITDEIYEHITYDGAHHIPIMTLEGMRNRTVLVNSMSKTFSVTGWRVGWVLAAPDLSDSIRKVHDFLTVGCRGAFARKWQCDSPNFR